MRLNEKQVANRIDAWHGSRHHWRAPTKSKHDNKHRHRQLHEQPLRALARLCGKQTGSISCVRMANARRKMLTKTLCLGAKCLRNPQRGYKHRRKMQGRHTNDRRPTNQQDKKKNPSCKANTAKQPGMTRQARLSAWPLDPTRQHPHMAHRNRLEADTIQTNSLPNRKDNRANRVCMRQHI